MTVDAVTFEYGQLVCPGVAGRPIYPRCSCEMTRCWGVLEQGAKIEL